jgi:hypothetical protein
MSQEQLFADSFMHTGLGAEWSCVAYTASSVGTSLDAPYQDNTVEYVGVVRVLSQSAPMYGAQILLYMPDPWFWQTPSYPTGGYDKWDDPRASRNGLYEPQLYWVLTNPDGSERTTVPPPAILVQLRWSVGVTVEAGIYRRDALYVGPPGPPPPPPVGDCPPRPDWPYVDPYVLASSGDGKVMRFVKM